MPTILIVEKTGKIKEVSYDETKHDLAKKAGHTTKLDLIDTWNVEIEETSYSIRLLGKTEGRANTENKYEFPPPADTKLFFGSCVLMRTVGSDIVSLTTTEWETIYEHLFHGFDELGEEDDILSYSTMDDDLVTTKAGYQRDGFVVDDDEEEIEPEEPEEEDEDEEEEEEERKVKKTVKKKTATKKKTTKKTPATITTTEYIDYADELTEEEYV